jgi:hypothetical protein
MNFTNPSGHICVEDDGGSDAGMSRNCGCGGDFTQSNFRSDERTTPNKDGEQSFKVGENFCFGHFYSYGRRWGIIKLDINIDGDKIHK